MLALVLLAFLLLSVWQFSGNKSVDDSPYIPGVEARDEYLQAASMEEVLLAGPNALEKEESKASESVDSDKKKELDKALREQPDSDDGYGFYDSLQASQWDVPVQRGIYMTAEDHKRASYRYMLQAASVRNRGEAVALVSKLKGLGLAASYSVSSSGYGEGWYRVNVGPFSNVSVMNKAEDVLVSMRMMPLKRRIQ